MCIDKRCFSISFNQLSFYPKLCTYWIILLHGTGTFHKHIRRKRFLPRKRTNMHIAMLPIKLALYTFNNNIFVIVSFHTNQSILYSPTLLSPLPTPLPPYLNNRHYPAWLCLFLILAKIPEDSQMPFLPHLLHSLATRMPSQLTTTHLELVSFYTYSWLLLFI